MRSHSRTWIVIYGVQEGEAIIYESSAWSKRKIQVWIRMKKTVGEDQRKCSISRREMQKCRKGSVSINAKSEQLVVLLLENVKYMSELQASLYSSTQVLNAPYVKKMPIE